MGQALSRISYASWAVLLLVTAYLVYALSYWHRIPLDGVTPIGQTDPDTWLRLTLVRDWMMGADWYDHLVHRSNAPGAPITSPWTRPLDMVIAALAYVQPADVELNLRVMRAGLLLPPLWLGLLLLGMQRAVRAYFPLPQASLMVVVMAAMLPALWNYLTLGNADHHGLLAVLFVWAMVGVLSPAPTTRQMILSGVLFGMQLWVSVEALVLLVVAYGWYGAQWLRGDTRAPRAFAMLATSVALAVFAAIAIERPVAAWATPVYDSISIAHGAALTLAALAAWVIARVRLATLRQRLTLGGILGICAGSLLWLTYPKLYLGPLVDAAPFILSDFLPHISEARPFYRIDAWTLMATSFIPWLAMILCVTPWILPKWAFYSKAEVLPLLVFVGATLLLYYVQQRWSYYMLPIAIIAVAPLLGSLFMPEHRALIGRWPVSTLVGLGPDAQARRRMPIVLAVLGTPFLLLMAQAGLAALHPPHASRNATADRDACYMQARALIRSGMLFGALGTRPLTLFTSTDLGSEILFFTPYRIVASNYHREGDGLAYVWGAEAMADAAALRTHLAARNVDALLLCPQAAAKQGSLFQAYAYGEPLPRWLTRLDYRLPDAAGPQAVAKRDAPRPILLRVRNT